MAPRASTGVQSGYELVRTGFQTAPLEFQNVLLLLEEVRLSFVLEHPCRLLNGEVSEFYRNAHIRSNVNTIKSKVKNVSIKIKASSINHHLRMPQVEAEDILLDEDTHVALDYCGLPQWTTSIKRKDMNPQGKLLTDIIGKVLLCKVGSHDYVSFDIFKLLIAIISRKRLNWGAILLERIKASFSAPNFGRILSLYLNQVDPDNFNMAAGVSMHHLKRIDSSMLVRWERVIPRQRGPRAQEREEEQEIPRNEEAPEPQEPAGTSGPPGEGEHAMTEQVTKQNQPSVSVQRSDPKPVVKTELLLDPTGTSGPSGEGRAELIFVLSSSSVEGESVADATSDVHVDEETGEDIIPEQESISVMDKGKGALVEREQSAGSHQRDPLALSTILLLPSRLASTPIRSSTLDRISPARTHSSSFLFPDEATLGGESSGPPPQSNTSLLRQIEAMFIQQKEYFDSSLKQVYDKIKEVDKNVNDCLNAVRHDISQFKADIDARLTRGDKALDMNITIGGKIYTKLIDLAEDTDLMHTSMDKFMSYIDEKVAQGKEHVMTSILEEAKKGEVSVLNQIDAVNFDLSEKIQAVTQFTHDSVAWFHSELTGCPPPQYDPVGPAQSDPVDPPPGEGDFCFPPFAYDQMRSEGDVAEKELDIPESSTSRQPKRRKLFGEGRIAKRPDPSKRQKRV